MKMIKSFLLISALALAACANDSELTKLTSAKEDFNKSVSRVVNYELGPRCSVTVTTNCAPQVTVDLLVADVNSCSDVIEAGGGSVAVRACNTKLENDLVINQVP